MTKKSIQTDSAPQENYTSSTVYSDKISAIGNDVITSGAAAISPSGNNPGAAFHGKGKIHALNADEEYQYWESNYVNRDYIDRSLSFGKSYGPAYRYGIDAFSQHGGRPFKQIEPDLQSGWEKFKDTSELTWDRVKEAVSDAYHRLLDDETSEHE